MCIKEQYSNSLTVAFIALISFLVLYLTLEREDYVLPFKKLTQLFIFLSGG
jgi:hypothetical protein